MLLRNISIVFLLAFVLVLCSSKAFAQNASWQMIHGDVIQVFPEEHKILLDSRSKKQVFVLGADCLILRTGRIVDLRSLRPISSGVYQDCLCWINPNGYLACILANYDVIEEDGCLVNRDIFGNQK